ncbi:multicopper oxidase domain-containing protein [Aurantimonas coralicida]|uniref:multicopper oxidase domain-containing protein n=1 Tax=Aurantimonas coralicida TaxID=182270 RepID=UPI0003FC70F7
MTCPISRRSFLLGSSAMLATTAIPRASAATRHRLVAAVGQAQIVPETFAGPTPVWAFNGTAPGPVLRVRAGERLAVDVENCLDQPTSVHWHGIRIDNGMDGVPGLTQAAIAPGEQFSYEFVPPDPGTYWYHSHNRSWEQNARGLHGALIVDEPELWRGADRDLVLVLDDWRLARDGAIADGFGQMMEWAHGGRIGNTPTVNGRLGSKIAVRPNERIRVRLINAANARIMEIAFAGLPVHLLALDGMPTTIEALSGTIQLAPAQRADLLVDFAGADGDTIALSLQTRDGPFEMATFALQGEPVRSRYADPVGLPQSGPAALPALSNAFRTELVTEGGAMGSMQGATHQGRWMDMRELVSRSRVWSFNGVAGDMDQPLATVARGRPIVFTLRNQTRWPHAMHVHGHHFRVVSRDGKPVASPVLRDTELMMPDETIEIAFVADNPGKWLLHCHMLEHAAGGMMTWFDVT